MITITEMTAKIEKEHARHCAVARDNGERLFPFFDHAIETDLLHSGLKGKAQAEITFMTDLLDGDLGFWCEVEKEKAGHFTCNQHHFDTIVVADYVKQLKAAGYQVSIYTFNTEICSKSGKTSYGNREFRTLYVSF